MLKISIPTDIQVLLVKALLKSGTHECGGVLMGEHIGTNHFRVSSLTVQKSGTIASFVRGITDAIKAIRLFHLKSVILLGFQQIEACHLSISLQ